jgi:hypothetical protein
VMRVPYKNRAPAIQFGDVICRAPEGDKPFSTLVNMTISDGYYSTCQARALIGAAIGGLCPEEQASIHVRIALSRSASHGATDIQSSGKESQCSTGRSPR